MKDQNQQESSEKKTILFIHYGENWIRGSEVCLLNLMTTISSQYCPILWTNNAPLHHRAIELGITSYHEPFSILLGWNKPQFNIKATLDQIKKTQILIKKHDISLIHVNSGAPNQWASIAAYLKRIPLVTQLHCDYLLRDRASLLLHLSPQIITVSKAISYNLLNDGFPNSYLKVIYNGVPQNKTDIETFSIRERLAISSEEKVLISVGSLIELKGFDRLISAIKKLHEKGQKVHLVILGEGPNRKKLERQIKNSNLNSFIHLLGERENVANWLNGGANLFVSGARNEAFGLVLVEAALAQLPILAPKVGGIPEVVIHQATGELYDSASAEEVLPDAIESMLLHSQKAKSLAKNAKARAQIHFSLQANTEKIESVYQALLTQKTIVHESRIKQIGYVFKSLLRPVKTYLHSKKAKIFPYQKGNVQ